MSETEEAQTDMIKEDSLSREAKADYGEYPDGS
jgi:hypothetical protein